MNESKVLPLTVVFSVFVVTIPGVNENTCEELPGGKCEVGAFTALTSTGYDGQYGSRFRLRGSRSRVLERA